MDPTDDMTLAWNRVQIGVGLGHVDIAKMLKDKQEVKIKRA